MLEFMFETASKLFILVLVTNAALPGVSEKEVNKGFSQPKYVLIYRTNMDHLESLHTTNKIVPIDKNHSQNQFCLNTNTSTRRQLLMYKASDFQVNVSKIEVNVLDSITLKVIMNVSGNISCHWTFKNITTPCNVNYCTLHSQIITLIVSRVTERHAGIYHLTTEGTNTINFPIFVRAKPRKPKIIMEKEGKILECTAESYPSSSLIWSSSSTSSSEIPYINHNKSIVSFGVTRIRKKISIRQCIHNHISCCASNIHGTECSSLYTQDLDRSNKESSVLNVFLKVGDPFLVRCIASYETYKFRIGWITNTNAGNTTEVLDVEESFVSSRHTRIRFLFITSVQLENSGLYTCTSTKHSHKTVKLTVIEKGFINSSITNNVHTIGEAENFCFEVRLKAYPLVRCQWYFSHKGFPSLLKKISGNSYSASFCDHGHKPGIYEFFAENEEAEFRTFFTLYIKKKPSLELSSGKNNIFCNSTSYPLATVSWKKCNEKSCAGSENITEGIQTMELDGKIFGSKSILSVLDPTVMTGGFSIECCAENAVGSICKRSYLPEQDKMRFSKTIFYTTIGIFGLVTILFFAFIVPKYKKQPGYERQLLMIQVIGSSENDYVYVDFTNTDYDPKWEFPRENLELGNVLGSGAFGKVMEAMAYGINKADVPVQVAIKMLKEKYEPSEKDALMSELKMMIHMGRHENIVNLLGACTISGPVYLIFEYCCYGDLLNYLRNNRENFHKTWTDVFAHNNFSFYHNLYNDQQFSNKARNVVQNQSYEPMNRESNTGMLSQKSDCDLLFHEDELTCPLNTDVDYRNARRYEDEDLHVLTFEDLLSFSYQVAKGMEFLTSRSCIHRDLAARNVLVTHGKVAKICDFGLARDIMQDSNYVVRGNARLPVKWMAPESLFEGSYTTRSDVWSYGILLWEIFSLGVNPYPGIQVDSNFYKLIQSGFKMEQPFYATEEIYSVIQSCWALDPGKRLAFSDLVSIFEKQLADAEVALYHNVKVCKYNSHYKNLPVSSMECTSIHSATSSLKESTPMNEDVQM